LSDSDSDGEPAGKGAVAKRNKNKSKKDRLAITEAGEDETTDDSMPDLMDVSDSSEMEEDFDDDEEEESEEDDDGEDDEDDDEYDYDSEDEENLRHLLHNAMDAANTVPGIYDARNDAVDLEALPEDTKNNPFLKLLGSLRGQCTQGSLCTALTLCGRSHVLRQLKAKDDQGGRAPRRVHRGAAKAVWRDRTRR
jgi:hypothetical protein